MTAVMAQLKYWWCAQFAAAKEGQVKRENASLVT